MRRPEEKLRSLGKVFSLALLRELGVVFKIWKNFVLSLFVFYFGKVRTRERKQKRVRNFISRISEKIRNLIEFLEKRKKHSRFRQKESQFWSKKFRFWRIMEEMFFQWNKYTVGLKFTLPGRTLLDQTLTERQEELTEKVK